MLKSIEAIKEKNLVGKKLTMSLAHDGTSELWRSFMPRRHEICNQQTNDLISMQVYPPTYFTDFRPTSKFEKWAAVAVKNVNNVPDEMETFLLQSGLYAVFHYKGSSTDNSIFQYIFGTWLPNSAYLLDDRPHFEILGEQYKNAAPNSEEEIWIPVKPK
jgi:AraC family transcriptional regulator